MRAERASSVRGGAVYVGVVPTTPREAFEAIFGFLFKLPRKTITIVLVLASLPVVIAIGLAITWWATLSDLDVVVSSHPSTLTEAQEGWIDNASQAIATDVTEGRRNSDYWAHAFDRTKVEIDAERQKKTIKPEVAEWIGKSECQIEESERQTVSDAERPEKWKSRMAQSALSPFLDPPTDKWNSHDTSTMVVLVKNRTSKPISGIRLVLKNARNVWRTDLHSPFLTKEEMA